MIGEIQEASARLNRLVGNLLDVTRLESGHVQAETGLVRRRRSDPHHACVRWNANWPGAR